MLSSMGSLEGAGPEVDGDLACLLTAVLGGVGLVDRVDLADSDLADSEVGLFFLPFLLCKLLYFEYSAASVLAKSCKVLCLYLEVGVGGLVWEGFLAAGEGDGDC